MAIKLHQTQLRLVTLWVTAIAIATQANLIRYSPCDDELEPTPGTVFNGGARVVMYSCLKGTSL